MADDRNLRHRFTVPVADTVVNEWIEKQSNLGFSLRTLIKAFVKAYGYQDATCLEFGTSVKKRGRPPKQVQIQYENMMSDSNLAKDDASPSFITGDPSSDAVMDMFNNTSIPEEPDAQPASNVVQAKPVNAVPVQSVLNNINSNIEEDDDGFVDPASLF